MSAEANGEAPELVAGRLKIFNAWRRGEGEWAEKTVADLPFSAAELGVTIDRAVELLRAHAPASDGGRDGELADELENLREHNNPTGHLSSALYKGFDKSLGEVISRLRSRYEAREFTFGQPVECRSGKDRPWMEGFLFIAHVPAFGYVVKGDLSPQGMDHPVRIHNECRAAKGDK